MSQFFTGFADELEKLSKDMNPQLAALREVRLKSKVEKDAEKIINSVKFDTEKGKNYLSSAALGAIASPLVTLSRLMVRRGASNAAIRRQIRKTVGSRKKKKLMGKLETGPTMTVPDIAGSMTQGAIMGGLVQALRDRVSEGKH